MKKLILLSFILALATSCATLKIAYSSTEDGKRTLMTSNRKLFSSQSYDFAIAMGARVSSQDTVLAVLITSDKFSNHGIFDKGNRLMIKLAGGEVIALENVYDKEFEETEETVNTTRRVNSYGYEYFYSPYDDAVVLAPYEVTSLVPSMYTRKKTVSYALYLISAKQISDICSNEVTKLRIEIEDKDLDMPIPGNASGIFSELYGFLKPNIISGVVRSEF